MPKKSAESFDVIIVGGGPAGLFAAHWLSEHSSLRVLLLEKGKPPLKRHCPIGDHGCVHCRPCNILCGVGGAGLFSDGKLNFIHKLGKTDLTQFLGLAEACQLIDETDGGRFPGLYLLITGTPAFFDGPQGVQRLAPLAQRLATDCGGDPRFDNPRAVQLRLTGFDRGSLVELGRNVREVFVVGSPAAERIEALVDDAYLGELADAVAGRLGGKVGISPRVFLKKLVGDVLDRVELFDDFDPRRDYALTVSDAELLDVERNAAAGQLGVKGLNPNDIALDLDSPEPPPAPR